MKKLDKKSIVLITLSTLGKISKQINILSFFNKKAEKISDANIYRIAI